MTAPGEDDLAEYDESEIRTITLAVIAGLVFGGIASGVAWPTLPLLDELLGISAVVLGIILSANRITRIPMNAPAGNVIDNYGARKPMVIGLFVQAIAPISYIVGLAVPRTTFAVLPWIGPVSTPAVVFTVGRGLWGISSAFVFLGGFATITYITTNENRGKWLGYMRGLRSIGFPSGLVVGGIVADLLSAQVAFGLAALLSLTAGIVAYLVLPDVRPETEERARLRDVPAIVRREPRIFPIGVGNFTLRFMFGGVVMATVVKYANTYDIQLSLFTAAGVSGVVLGLGAISSGLTTFFSGRLSDRLSNRALITVPTFLVMSGGAAVLASVPTLEGMIAGTVLIGIGTGGTGPALLAIVGDITPGNEVGRMGGVYNFLGDIGSTLGPLLAVPMVDTWFGFRTTYWLCVGLVLLTLAVVAVSLLRLEIETAIRSYS